jgi:predicted  nucleic acid-binding Zn-ribbon protein
MTTEPNKNKSTLTILLLLLIASIGVNIYQYKSHSSAVVSHINMVDSLKNDQANVERELTSVSMELEKYRGIAGNLDTLLNDANGKLAAQEAKIRKLLSSEKNSQKLSAELKVQLAELYKLRDEYLEKIDVLLAENQALKNENADLNESVNDLNEQKNLLESKVLTASQLKVEYVKMASFKKKGSGRFTESVLAKLTNKIESCFTIMDNKISTSGDKMAFLVIVAPNGKPLLGFTKAEFKNAQGETVFATASQKVNYTGEKQNLCLAYENDERILESGTYTIEIYMEGSLVHQSAYILR